MRYQNLSESSVSVTLRSSTFHKLRARSKSWCFSDRIVCPNLSKSAIVCLGMYTGPTGSAKPRTSCENLVRMQDSSCASEMKNETRRPSPILSHGIRETCCLSRGFVPWSLSRGKCCTGAKFVDENLALEQESRSDLARSYASIHS